MEFDPAVSMICAGFDSAMSVKLRRFVHMRISSQKGIKCASKAINIFLCNLQCTIQYNERVFQYCTLPTINRTFLQFMIAASTLMVYFKILLSQKGYDSGECLRYLL